MSRERLLRNEKDVKVQVKKILDRHNIFWWCPPANAYGRSGISDFNCLGLGVFIAIETKFGSNKPTGPQIAFLNSVKAEKGFAFVVNENNLDFLDQFLESFAIAAAAQSRGEAVPDEHGSRMLNCIYALTRY
jgi:hypothetical protein